MTAIEIFTRLFAGLVYGRAVWDIAMPVLGGHPSRTTPTTRGIATIAFLLYAIGSLQPLTLISWILIAAWIIPWWMPELRHRMIPESMRRVLSPISGDNAEDVCRLALTDLAILILCPVFAFGAATEWQWAKHDGLFGWTLYATFGPLTLRLLANRLGSDAEWVKGFLGPKSMLTSFGFAISACAISLVWSGVWLLSAIASWWGAAIFLDQMKGRIGVGSYRQGASRLAPILLSIGLCLAAVLVRGDVGGALLTIGTLGVLFLSLGLLRTILSLLAFGLAFVYLLLNTDLSLRFLNRIRLFIDHREGLQSHVEYATYQIANGGVTGTGSIGKFLPYQRSDSLMAGVVSMLGPLSIIGMLVATGVLVIHFCRTATTQSSGVRLIRLIAALNLGLVTAICTLWQVGALPVVGLAPFGAYGPSAMLSWTLLLGVAIALPGINVESSLAPSKSRPWLPWAVGGATVVVAGLFLKPALFSRQDMMSRTPVDLETEIRIRKAIDDQNVVPGQSGPRIASNLNPEKGQGALLQNDIKSGRVVQTFVGGTAILKPKVPPLINLGSSVGRALSEAHVE